MVEAKNRSVHEHWTSCVCLRSGEVPIWTRRLEYQRLWFDEKDGMYLTP